MVTIKDFKLPAACWECKIKAKGRCILAGLPVHDLSCTRMDFCPLEEDKKGENLDKLITLLEGEHARLQEELKQVEGRE